jgi:thioredoxin reductase (NADPH)
VNPFDNGHDCIIIGAGPGGLQAAIHLGRYNRRVLLLDRGGGSTKSAVDIENFLTWDHITGQDIVARGLAQARRFGVRMEKKRVDLLLQKDGVFEAVAGEARYRGRFVLVSTGVSLQFPRIKNMHRFFGRGYYTCVDCDGFQTTGKKLLIAGNSAETMRLAYAMKQMFTSEIAILLTDYQLPEEERELAAEEKFQLYDGTADELLGNEHLTGLRLTDGRVIHCEVVMAGFGFRFNDRFLTELPLSRDSQGNILVNAQGESSVQRLYVVGSLRPGNPQVIIAAGQGATAAIEINKQLLSL